MKRPSDVRNGPIVGLDGMPTEPVDAGAHCSPVASDRSTASPMAQAPTLKSDTSTTAGSPLRSRANSALAMAPAIVIPPIESP